MSRKGKRRQRPRSKVRGRNDWKLRAELLEVEFAVGHDGFLRGKPEPVLIFAAFAVGSKGAILLGRVLRRIPVTGPYPSVSKVSLVTERELLAVPVPAEYDRVLLLCLAIEEDSGEDVSALYGALATPETLESWTINDLMPEPLPLGEAGLGEPSLPPAAKPVNLLRHGAIISESCHKDDWIGAAAVVLTVGRARNNQWRFHFVSEDGRNDWTGVFQVRL